MQKKETAVVAYNDRAVMASQRERVFKHRVEIRQMLDDGATIKIIKERLGLDDMPYRTFYRHAAKLRDASRPAMTNVAPVAQAPAASPAIAPAQPAIMEAAQPERESPEEKPKRKPARKTRKFVDGSAEYEKKHGKPKPLRWDPADARKIK